MIKSLLKNTIEESKNHSNNLKSIDKAIEGSKKVTSMIVQKLNRKIEKF